MANDRTERSKTDLKTLLKREADQEQRSRNTKRTAQHEHWMRVMMEGQSTPDLSYQSDK